MTAVFPFFILIIFIFAFFVKDGGRFITQQKLKWLLGGYVMILLASLLVLQVLPEERFSQVDEVNNETLRKAQEASQGFFEMVMAGKPEQVDGIEILRQWDFEFQGKQLSIGTDDYAAVMVFVERKKENDGKIEATHYVTKTILDKVDVTAGIKSPTLSLKGNRLMKTEPEEYKIEIARFKREFLTEQFLKDSEQQETPAKHYLNHAFGANILYVRIPRDVEVLSKAGVILIDES